MQTHRIYVLHPQELHFPEIRNWIAEAIEVLRCNVAWSNIEFQMTEFDRQNSFRARDVHSRVRDRIGPVVVIGGDQVQRSALEDLRTRLREITVVEIDQPTNSTEVMGLLERARDRYESGHPFLPRKYVAAILLLRKLNRHQMWAGKDKGYMDAAKLAKGRGVPEQFADIIYEVANDLFAKGILVKKPSRGRTKYALNRECQQEIHAILERNHFEDHRVYQVLMKDTRTESARLLDTSETENQSIG